MTGKSLGMPAARPFTTKGATAKKPIYVINATHLDQIIYEAGFYGDDIGLDFEETADFEEKDVLGFSESEFASLLKETGLTIVAKTASGTRNVSWVWLGKESNIPKGVRKFFRTDTTLARYPVTVRNFNGDKQEVFSAIAERILGPAVKRPIVIDVPHGYPKKHVPNGNFAIYIWSTPKDRMSKTVNPPRMIWGTTVEMREPAFAPLRDTGGATVESLILYDGTYAVAELFPDALYVHHDLVHYGAKSEMIIFATLLTKVAELVGNQKAWKEFLAKEEERRREERTRAFKMLIERSIPHRAHRRKTEIVAARKKAEDLRRSYFAAERERFAVENGSPELAETTMKRFIAEIERLQTGKVALIKDVEVKDVHEIVIHTDLMYVKHPNTGRYHELGEFAVTLDLESGRLASIRNKTRTVNNGGDTCHTPHVFSRGGENICLGNIGAEVQAYLAHYEVEAVASLLTAFLQSVAPAHAYVLRAQSFPVAQDVAKLKERGLV